MESPPLGDAWSIGWCFHEDIFSTLSGKTRIINKALTTNYSTGFTKIMSKSPINTLSRSTAVMKLRAHTGAATQNGTSTCVAWQLAGVNVTDPETGEIIETILMLLVRSLYFLYLFVVLLPFRSWLFVLFRAVFGVKRHACWICLFLSKDWASSWRQLAPVRQEKEKWTKWERCRNVTWMDDLLIKSKCY